MSALRPKPPVADAAKRRPAAAGAAGDAGAAGGGSAQAPPAADPSASAPQGPPPVPRAPAEAVAKAQAHIPHLVTREELEALVQEAVQSVVGEGVFQPNKLAAWTGNVVEGVLKRLAALNKPLKFVVSAHVVQRLGAGLHTAVATYWDAGTDGKVCVVWESQTLTVVTTVFYMMV